MWLVIWNQPMSKCYKFGTRVEPWKKFGNQIKRQYPVRNYDYVLCNAEYWKEPYSQAFGVNTNQVLVTGMPRIDTLLNRNERDEFFLKYPELKR